MDYPNELSWDGIGIDLRGRCLAVAEVYCAQGAYGVEPLGSMEDLFPAFMVVGQIFKVRWS
jgi:hypothetical protein